MNRKFLNKLSLKDLDFFDTEGYLMVPDIFNPSDLEPVRLELHQMIDLKVQDMLRNLELDLEDSFPVDGFDTRLARIKERNPGAAERIMKYLEGFHGGGYRGESLFNLIVNDKLVSVIEDFVGPEIVGSSVYRLRPKLPKIDRGVVPWHQDSGFWMPHCDTELIITCWIPLVDATIQNGCLTVLPRAHKGKIVEHHTDGFAGFLQIKDENLPQGGEPAAIPVPLGGALFFTNRTPHCSTPNNTDIIRWSLDLRYQSAEVPSNYNQIPEEFSMDRPDYEISCNPPEADFLIRTGKHPDKLIQTYEQFKSVREAFEQRVDRSKVDYRRQWPSMKGDSK